MKVVNYLIALAALLFFAAWMFNHFDAWVGLAILAAIAYVLINKALNKVKEIQNEKN